MFSLSALRSLVACALVFGLSSAVATGDGQASEVLLFSHGRAAPVQDRFLPSRSASDLPVSPGATGHAAALVRHRASASGYRANVAGVHGAIDGALTAQLISQTKHDQWTKAYDDALAIRARLKGRCNAQLNYVIYTVERMAKARSLTASRMPAVFEQLARNTQFWGATPSPSLGIGERVRFNYGPIFQHYKGEGLQLQPLATFGKANGIYSACTGDGAPKEGRCPLNSLTRLLAGMKALVSQRGSFPAWEYYFDFDGGRPPWASGMAQATAIQAYSRASVFLHRPDYLQLASAALGIFRAAPPLGVRVREGVGVHYLLYTFAPGQRVANAFTQTVIGLFDYWKISHDPLGKSLFLAGERELRHAIHLADAKTWSYYSYPKGPRSTLSYHVLLAGFLSNLYDRTHHIVYRSYSNKFLREAYKAGYRPGSGGGGTPRRQTCGYL